MISTTGTCFLQKSIQSDISFEYCFLKITGILSQSFFKGLSQTLFLTISSNFLSDNSMSYFSFPPHNVSTVPIFLFYLGFFFTVTDNSQNSKGAILISLYYFHQLTNIETFTQLRKRYLPRIFNLSKCDYQSVIK